MQEGRTRTSTVTLLRNTLRVVEILAGAAGPLSPTEIARRAVTNKGTVLGILYALSEQAYVQKDDAAQTYAVGPALATLSELLVRRRLLQILAKPFLESLARTARESAFLAVPNGETNDIIELAEVQKRTHLQKSLGLSLPITASAAGKVVLATMTESKVREIIEEKGLPTFTRQSFSHVGAFLGEIRRTRIVGYAIDHEEYVEGIMAVAAPVRIREQTLAALWIAGSVRSFSADKLPSLIDMVKGTTDALSRAAGLGTRFPGADT